MTVWTARSEDVCQGSTQRAEWGICATKPEPQCQVAFRGDGGRRRRRSRIGRGAGSRTNWDLDSFCRDERDDSWTNRHSIGIDDNNGADHGDKYDEYEKGRQHGFQQNDSTSALLA